jgi:hypothetical protein
MSDEDENPNPQNGLPLGYILREGADYAVDERGRWVFTAAYLIKRGYCCESGCRNCPYGFRK